MAAPSVLNDTHRACQELHVEGNNALRQRPYTPYDLLGLRHDVELPTGPGSARFELTPNCPASKNRDPTTRPEQSFGTALVELPPSPPRRPLRGSVGTTSPRVFPRTSSKSQGLPSTHLNNVSNSRVSTNIPSSPDSSANSTNPTMFSPATSIGSSVTETVPRRDSLQSLNPPDADMILGNLKGAEMWALTTPL